MVKKVFKWVGIVAGAIISLILLVALILNKPRPEGKNPAKADEVAKKMLSTLNHNAYEQTRYLTWTFSGVHNYVWDKKNHLVKVSWDDLEVILNSKNINEAVVFKNGTSIEKEKTDIVNSAWAYFCNDSFWLVAPHKVFDKGATRTIVDVEEAKYGLFVEYSSGGVTPGDAYLWKLDDDFTPLSYQMWVSILPIGGLEASWENWKKTTTNTVLPQNHKLGFLNIALTNVKTGNSLPAIGLDKNPFESFEKMYN